MGTKVTCKSYLPGSYTMRDLKKDAGTSWLFCYEDMTQSGKSHSDFTLSPANGYIVYDKEILRQTMLRHEEIFKEQVCELHRLYRIQRTLMDELKRKGEHSFCLQVNSSESSPLSIKMLPKDRKKAWQGHGFPLANASYSWRSVSGINDGQAQSKVLNGSSSQTGIVLKENGCSQGVNELTGSKIQKFPRRMFDLQLPADAYIDSEDAEHTEEKKIKIFIKPQFGAAHPTKVKFGVLPEDDVKLALGTSQNHGNRNETQKLGSHIPNGMHPHSLLDLNEPLREASCEDVEASSCNFAVQNTHCEELQEHQNSMRSSSEFPGFQTNLVQDTYKSGGGSVSMNVGRSEEGWDHSLFKNEFGQSSSHENYFTSNVSNTNAGQSSEHVEIKTKDAHYFPSILSLKKSEIESWFTEKPTQSIEPSDSSCIANTKYLGLTVPTTSGPFSALLRTENAISASSPFSNVISPVAVQALPCVSESTMNIQSKSSSTSSQNFGSACEKWQYSHGSRSTLSKRGETCFRRNGFRHSFRSESSASSHVYLPSANFDKPNLNNSAGSAYEKLDDHGPQKYLKGLHDTDVKTANDAILDLGAPNGFQLGHAAEQKRPTDLQGKRESTLGGLSWLKTKSPCGGRPDVNNGVYQEEQDAEQGFSPLMLNYPTTCEIDEKKEMDYIPSLDVLPLILEPKGTIVQQNEASDTSKSKRILGFPVPQRTQHSHTDNARDGVKEKFLHTDASFRSKLLDLEKQTYTELDLGRGVEKCSNGFTDHLGYNTSATNVNQPKSSEHSSKDDAHSPSTSTVPYTARRFASEIDLEAPITCLSEEQMLSAESSLDLNQLVSPAEPESKRDIPQATQIGDETIVRLAAETIHTMSLDKHIHPEGIAGCPPPSASVDNLNWFAHVVTSNSYDLESSRGEEQRSSDIDGMDYFEYMTLHLKEAKIDECCSKPLEIENLKDEETGVAHLLLTKPRRGQGRRRRQKRDFQKDILPGLATLSRHEVTEDLQIIGGLMRASGQSWQAGGSRRNNGRNRSHSQTRGRGRLRGRGTSAAAAAAAAVVEIALDPHPRQPNNEVGSDGRNILGWGRTTRRCWRQRCSSGYILVPPPT